MFLTTGVAGAHVTGGLPPVGGGGMVPGALPSVALGAGEGPVGSAAALSGVGIVHNF